MKNLKLLIDGKETKPMVPWFKGFKGTIEEIDIQRYAVSGEISTLSDTKVEITELPIRLVFSYYSLNIKISKRLIKNTVSDSFPT